MERLHAHGREIPAAAWRGAALAQAALSAGSCPGTRGTSTSTLLRPEISEREIFGSGTATWTVATGWQQKLVDPVLACILLPCYDGLLLL